jgi:hypothetical protein
LNQCTTCKGKLDQHVTRFPGSVRIWPSTIRISRGPHIPTFHEVIDRVGQSHCSREKGIPDCILSTPADRSVGPHPVSQPLTTIEVVEKATQQATRLTWPIYQHVIGTFNACSRETTHRSLNDTGGGYSLGGAGFLHTTPRSSQPVVSTFHLSAPPGL